MFFISEKRFKKMIEEEVEKKINEIGEKIIISEIKDLVDFAVKKESNKIICQYEYGISYWNTKINKLNKESLNISENIKNDFNKYLEKEQNLFINKEKFIDEIIERINRKQLK